MYWIDIKKIASFWVLWKNVSWRSLCFNVLDIGILQHKKRQFSLLSCNGCWKKAFSSLAMLSIMAGIITQRSAVGDHYMTRWYPGLLNRSSGVGIVGHWQGTHICPVNQEVSSKCMACNSAFVITSRKKTSFSFLLRLNTFDFNL